MTIHFGAMEQLVYSGSCSAASTPGIVAIRFVYHYTALGVACRHRLGDGAGSPEGLSQDWHVGLNPGLLSPAVAAVGVPEHAQFGTCVWNMRALLVCDERWTGA